MKKYIFIAAASLMMMTSCKDEQKDPTVTVTRERDSLLSVIDARETTVNEFISSFNEVERNLDSVKSKQHIILLNSDKLTDLKANQKARINAEILAINELMDANTKKLKLLSRKLNRADKKNAKLEETIILLNAQLTQKYIELSELNTRLTTLNAQVAQLETTVNDLLVENFSQSQSLNAKTAESRTAYYIIGSSRDLQMWGLIDKEGGLLGVGQTSKLSNNLDKGMFTKIDYLETTSIQINRKGIKIVTTHPTGSFSLEKDGKMVNNIMINDPEKFWSASKYLVITL